MADREGMWDFIKSTFLTNFYKKQKCNRCTHRNERNCKNTNHHGKNLSFPNFDEFLLFQWYIIALFT